MAEAWTTVDADQGSDGGGEVTKYTIPGVEWFPSGGPVERCKTVVGAFDGSGHFKNAYNMAVV